MNNILAEEKFLSGKSFSAKKIFSAGERFLSERKSSQQKEIFSLQEIFFRRRKVSLWENSFSVGEKFVQKESTEALKKNRFKLIMAFKSKIQLIYKRIVF